MWTPILTETRHHFSREQLHRAANLLLWQAAEVHPAEHLADSHGAHRLDVARDGVWRPEGDGLADEIVPVDLREALGLRAKAGLQAEEHTSELQSQSNLVCRLLLEKKK